MNGFRQLLDTIRNGKVNLMKVREIPERQILIPFDDRRNNETATSKIVVSL